LGCGWVRAHFRPRIKQELRSLTNTETALDKELGSLELEEKRLDEIFPPLMSNYTEYQLIAKLRLEQYKRLMNDLQDVSAEEEGAENNFLLPNEVRCPLSGKASGKLHRSLRSPKDLNWSWM